MKYLKIIGYSIAAVFVVVFGIWLAMFFNVNIGHLLNKLLGGKFNPVPDPVDLKGLKIGKAYPIKENHSPLRDKSVVELQDGPVVQLPAGIIDTEVDKVILVSQGVVNVVKKSTDNLTGIFD